MQNCFKLLDEKCLNLPILFELLGQKLGDGINEAGTGVEMEAGDDLVNDWHQISVIPFNFEDGVDDIEIFGWHLRVFLYLFAVVDAAGPHWSSYARNSSWSGRTCQ